MLRNSVGHPMQTQASLPQLSTLSLRGSQLQFFTISKGRIFLQLVGFPSVQNKKRSKKDLRRWSLQLRGIIPKIKISALPSAEFSTFQLVQPFNSVAATTQALRWPALAKWPPPGLYSWTARPFLQRASHAAPNTACSLSNHRHVPSHDLWVILHKMQPREVGETQGGARVSWGQAGNKAQRNCKCWRFCSTVTLGACVGKGQETSCLLLQTAGICPLTPGPRKNPPRAMQAATWVGEILQVLLGVAVREATAV